ncbi:MAG: hypothetical protein HY093_03170 [Candidatus Liptonbacteria bacterium]|nr:hypothetical protein [Candidatus Liptonbacteria bacterium]
MKNKHIPLFFLIVSVLIVCVIFINKPKIFYPHYIYTVSLSPEKKYLLQEVDLENSKVNNVFSLDLPKGETINSAISYVPSYLSYLFIDDGNVTNKWLLYAFNTQARSLEIVKTFEASMPTVSRIQGQDNTVLVNETVFTDSQKNKLYISRKDLFKLEFEKDYGEVPQKRLIQIKGNNVKELDQNTPYTLLSEDSTKTKQDIQDIIISKDFFKNGFRWFSSYITNNSKNRSIAYFSKTPDSSQFIASVIHDKKIVDTYLAVSPGHNIHLLKFSPDNTKFYAINYVVDHQNQSSTFDVYDSNNLKKLSSTELVNVNPGFYANSIFSSDKHFLITNISKIPNSYRPKDTSNTQSYLLIYNLETQKLSVINSDQYITILLEQAGGD